MISRHIDREDLHMSSRERTPDEPSTENTTAVAEPPATGSEADRPSFAERVGQRSRVTAPDPFGIARDNLAGVRLFESKRDRQMAIKFGEGRPEDKPSQAVIEKLKDAGYHWNPTDRIWAHAVGGDSAMSTRIEAERLYQEVRQMIRQEKGIESGPEVPF
jgi:hypothetical protein